MPISINGSGTVTGISVGGLPDGIVDTDMIAANAVTLAKSAGRKVIQVVSSGIDNGEHMVSTTSLTYVTDSNLPNATITPISTSSDIFIVAHVGMQNDNADQIENTIFRQQSGLSDVDLSGSNTYGLSFQGITGGSDYGGTHITVVDTSRPSGTSAITYKWYGRSEFGGDVKIRHKGSICMTLLEFEP